jgi:hypothetical protein
MSERNRSGVVTRWPGAKESGHFWGAMAMYPYPPSRSTVWGFQWGHVIPPGCDRALNAAEAEHAAERFLLRNRLAWEHPQLIEPLGILGYRLWFRTPATERLRYGTRALDVRLDGTVCLLNFPAETEPSTAPLSA